MTNVISGGMAKGFEKLTHELIERSDFFHFWRAEKVDRESAVRFLDSFDALVKSFPALIALGASRAADERSRVVLAVNLYQECGEGNPERTHYAIYRKFRETAGLASVLASDPPFAVRWRETLQDYLRQASSGAVLGALAAGEFLAEPALSRVYPILKNYFPNADQEYFTKHLVLETEHVEEITEIMARQAEMDGDWAQVETGFRFGLSVWEAYFNALARSLAPDKAFNGR
ncbi:MAG: iron-containing redox enzyme family protein [bacterium]